MPGDKKLKSDSLHCSELVKASGEVTGKETPISSRTRSHHKNEPNPSTLSSKSTKVIPKQRSKPYQHSATTKSTRVKLKSDRNFKRAKGQSKPVPTRQMASDFEMPMEVEEAIPVTAPSAANLEIAGKKGDTSKLPLKEDTDDSHCVVCMCPPVNPKTLDKCGHIFCKECIDQCFNKINPVCPICGVAYGECKGNMPYGTMHVHCDPQSQLPGYSGCGTIMIQYNFPDGIQTNEHPRPGKKYYGTQRVAFLPDNAEGRKVLGLLQRAFDSRMTFTVGRSATTGLDDQVIWNDVHHKTRVHGGPTAFGYPDPTYLNRVQEELASKGIR